MPFSSLKPGKGFKPRTAPLARAPFRRDVRGNYGGLKAGKKMRENRRALSVFKKECARLGIERCEVRGPNCTGTEDLTWAHGRKRRELLEGELETFAIVACAICHRPLDEELTHAEMAAEVSRIIQLRPERYLEAA
jgi:hypothetical protein